MSGGTATLKLSFLNPKKALAFLVDPWLDNSMETTTYEVTCDVDFGPLHKWTMEGPVAEPGTVPNCIVRYAATLACFSTEPRQSMTLEISAVRLSRVTDAGIIPARHDVLCELEGEWSEINEFIR